jgi:hypothetical protein
MGKEIQVMSRQLAKRGRTSKRLAHRALKEFIVLTMEFSKEGATWLGFCRELGTATDGRTLLQVEKELMKLILLHLNGLDDIGEREKLFKERGIKVYKRDVPAEVLTEVPTQVNTFVQVKSIPVGRQVADPVAV